jgi:two-component system, OmpR family, response regulator CpxR
VDRILIIDDDRGLCALLKEYLQPEGFQIETIHDGNRAVEELGKERYDLVVLDIVLPGRNGLEVVSHLRWWSRAPILILTARGDDVDRIVGLEMGADDYLPKPFNARELLARIRAILRRAKQHNGDSDLETPTTPQRLAVGDVVLDLGTRSVYRAGIPVELTTVEFSLLEILVRSAGRVVSRDSLIRRVLNRGFDPYDRSIDVHVSSIRRKLGARMGETERIKPIRGVGYLYCMAPGPVDNHGDEKGETANSHCC